MIKRMAAVVTAITLMLSVCAVRIHLLQREVMVTTAYEQSTYTLTVNRTRGTIEDCHGVALTNSLTQKTALLLPTVSTVTAVQSQLDGEVKQTILSALEQNKPCVSAVTADFSCADAMLFDTKQTLSVTAPHLIGYLNSDGKAVTGIERDYDDVLSASALSVTLTVDANGRPLSGTEPVVSGQANNDNTVRLTLDSSLCKLVDSVLAETTGKWAAVVLESSTGKVRAMASTPSFSVSNVGEALQNEDAPLVNRALSLYNVGSVFKICVAAAALQNNVPMTRQYPCLGSIAIGQNTFHCSAGAHGTPDMTTALAKSCNCYFIQLAQDIGADAIYNMCVRMGFNRSITLSSSNKAKAGVLPSLQTLHLNAAALANFSFGQGELMLSPLHIAAMMAAVDNGGQYITPTLVERVTKDGATTKPKSSDPLPVLTEMQCDLLQKMLGEVLISGTGQAAKPADGTAYGKTATAESGYREEGKTINQSWFAGCYQGYTIVILRENGVSGGVDCAPVFAQICDGLDG